MESAENNLRRLDKGKYEIDVKGYSCPYPEVIARRSLEEMNSGEILVLKTDNKPSSERVPAALKEEGHESQGVEQKGEALWEIKIRKK